MGTVATTRTTRSREGAARIRQFVWRASVAGPVRLVAALVVVLGIFGMRSPTTTRVGLPSPQHLRSWRRTRPVPAPAPRSACSPPSDAVHACGHACRPPSPATSHCAGWHGWTAAPLHAAVLRHQVLRRSPLRRYAAPTGGLLPTPAPDDQENTMHAFTRALGASTLAVALGLGAAACGSDAPSVTGAEPSTTDHNDADADFASEMLQHHALAPRWSTRPLDPSTPRPRGGRARGADPRRPGAGDRDLHRLAHRVGRGGSRDRALSRQRRSRHG